MKAPADNADLLGGPVRLTRPVNLNKRDVADLQRIVRKVGLKALPTIAAVVTMNAQSKAAQRRGGWIAVLMWRDVVELKKRNPRLSLDRRCELASKEWNEALPTRIFLSDDVGKRRSARQYRRAYEATEHKRKKSPQAAAFIREVARLFPDDWLFHVKPRAS